MKSTHLPATTVKTLLALAQQPHARIILVNETSFLLDAQLHAHKLISNKTFSSMQSKQWITTPQERGQQLAECALTERGKAVAASIEALKLQFQQLPLDLEFITKHVEATQLAFSALPETVPQAEEPKPRQSPQLRARSPKRPQPPHTQRSKQLSSRAHPTIQQITPQSKPRTNAQQEQLACIFHIRVPYVVIPSKHSTSDFLSVKRTSTNGLKLFQITSVMIVPAN